LTMPLATWLGASQAPGEAAGFGPLPAEDARALAGLVAARPGSRWCLTFTDSAGRAIAHGCATARPAPSIGTSGPQAPSDGHPRARAPSTGITRSTGITSSTGGGGGTELGQPRSRAGPGGWALTVTILPLAAGECGHERETPGYRPSAALRHALVIRQRTCSFPICRRPANRCDQDHTIPYDQGGRTCECNTAPLCRRHHRAKQVGGWQLDQPEPGILVWRPPHGRSYRVVPDTYPD